MRIAANTRPIGIKLTAKQYEVLSEYLVNCYNNAFEDTEDIQRVHRMREYFYQWHLYAVIERMIKLYPKFIALPHGKTITLQLFEPERRSLSVMFQRIEAKGYMLTIESLIINQLTPLHPTLKHGKF